MKTSLLLALSSVVAAGLLPSLPAKMVLSALVLFAVLSEAANAAPAGYQDQKGFHLFRAQSRAGKGRAFWAWLFRDRRRAA